jgi:hypothetical protein
MKRHEYAIFSFQLNLCYEKEKTFIITDAQCPKKSKNHALLLLQMQASFTTQKKEFIYILFLILMCTESKYKSFNAPLLSIRRKSPMQTQKDMKQKGYKQSMHSRQ